MQLLMWMALAYAIDVNAASLPMNLTGNDVVSGKEVRQKFDEGAGVVVVFLSARCPCSKSHEPILSQLAQTWSAKGYRFVGVHSNLDESASETESHFKAAALPFPVVQDANQQLADAFGALKTPHAYVVKQGEVVYQGGVDSSQVAAQAEHHYLEDALRAIHEGREPPIKQARALGCVIKRN